MCCLPAAVLSFRPGAGLKPHFGSPGRIVSSMALHAPAGSTLTVAGVTRDWAEGQMLHFDDSFLHSVANPSPTEFRIVLALVTWHPSFYASERGEEAEEPGGSPAHGHGHGHGHGGGGGKTEL